MINARAQRRLPHTWIKLVIVKPHPVQIGRATQPSVYHKSSPRLNLTHTISHLSPANFNLFHAYSNLSHANSNISHAQVRAPIETSNGLIYRIDAVLQPQKLPLAGR